MSCDCCDNDVISDCVTQGERHEIVVDTTARGNVAEWSAEFRGGDLDATSVTLTEHDETSADEYLEWSEAWTQAKMEGDPPVPFWRVVVTFDKTTTRAAAPAVYPALVRLVSAADEPTLVTGTVQIRREVAA